MDPRARLLLTAEDTTAAAFNAVDARLRELEAKTARTSTGVDGSIKTMHRGVMQLRTALGMLGIAFSGRAMAAWMTRSLETTSAIGEQRIEIDRAREAFADFKEASDRLGESLAVQLTPAVLALADALDALRRFRGDATPAEILDSRIAETEQEIARLDAIIRTRENAWSAISKIGLDALRAQRDQLAENLRLLQHIDNTAQKGDGLEEIDTKAIGARALPRDEIGLMLSRQREKDADAARERQRKLDEEASEDRERQAKVDAEHELELVFAVAQERDRIALEEQEQIARRRDLLAQQLDDVTLFTMSEVELEAESWRRRQEIVDQALQDNMISERRHAQLSTDLERRTQAEITRIRQREAQAQARLRAQQLSSVANMFGALAALTAAGGEQSKKNFELSKKLAIAEAIVNTHASVTYALKNPPGPPWSYVQAAAALAYGMAQVRAISSTTWQGAGGGGAGGGGGSGAGMASPQMNERQLGMIDGQRTGGRGGAVINITIQSPIGRIDGETARVLARAIGEEVNSNDFEFMDRGSRQVLTIRGDGIENEG